MSVIEATLKLPSIYGFNKTSEAGGNVFTPSIFVQGCNLRCPFCFNSMLAKSKMKKEDVVSIEEVNNFILENECDMIIISGGEPLMIKNIENLINHFKSIGCRVGLSTHGIFHDRLKSVISELSYVAMDIKSSDKKIYNFLNLIKDSNSFENVLKSKEILINEKNMRDDFNYEIRTSLYPPYVSYQTIKELSELIDENEKWILQQYRPTKTLYDMEATKNVEPYSFDELQEILAIAKEKVKNVSIRYV